MADQGRIHFIDTTNRDGVRSSRLCLSPLQKTMINLQLNELGVGESELGLPGTHHQLGYINGNCRLQELGILTPIRLRGWVNAMQEEMEHSLEHTRLKHVFVSVPSSGPLIKSRYGADWSFERLVGSVCRTIELAKKEGMETVTVGASESPHTSDSDLMMFARRARDAGADRYRYCDTWGYEDPWTMRERVKWLASEIKIPIEIHCHDDLGMAVANAIGGALGALDAGVDAHIHTTVLGVGERAGNTDLISVLLALKKSRDLHRRDLIGDRIDLAKAWKLARYAAYALRWPISPRQVGLGKNAVIDATRLHIDGAVRETQEYEVYNVEELGCTEPEIVEMGRWVTSGAYGGIKGFRNIYGKLEIEFKDQKEANMVLDLVRMANLQNQQPLTGDELRFIARHPDIAKEIMTFSV